MSTHTRTPMRAWTYSYFYAAEKKNISICQVRYMVPVETIPACRTGVGGALACHNLKASDLVANSFERARRYYSHAFCRRLFPIPIHFTHLARIDSDTRNQVQQCMKKFGFLSSSFFSRQKFSSFQDLFFVFSAFFCRKGAQTTENPVEGSPPFYRPAILIEEGIKVP